MEVQKKFGERVRTLRQEKGLTEEQLAAACGLPSPYLISIENGQAEIQLTELLEIVKNLQTTVAELLEGIC